MLKLNLQKCEITRETCLAKQILTKKYTYRVFIENWDLDSTLNH